MRAAGLLHGWVQQNHDGLPQRAGVPQAFVNEIHGSWFDPANPTVGFGEPLREDLFAALLAEELKCDLCLALGTSLCDTPSTADRIAVTPALRSHWETPAEQIGEKALGLAVVSLQRTRLDPLAAVRVYAPLDEVLEALATALGLALPDADAVDTAPDVAAFDAAPGAAADAATRLRPGDEAVVAAGPDRGNVLRAVRRTQLGDLELSLAGAPGSPPRRALLGSWWLGRGSGPPPALLPPGAEVPPQRTLASLLPLLPPWAAAALGLPCAAGSARRSPVELGPDAGLAVEGLWEGSSASADGCVHRPAQPLRLVLASCAVGGGRVFGAGYSAWPAGGAAGAPGRAFFVLQGEVRADGRVRIMQHWDVDPDASTESAAPTEFVGQAAACEAGLAIAGAWRRSSAPSAPHGQGAFALHHRPSRLAGRWEPGAGASGGGPLHGRCALSCEPPLLFGAAERRGGPGQPLLVRGAFLGGAAEFVPGRPRGQTGAHEVWVHTSLPPRGGSLPRRPAHGAAAAAPSRPPPPAVLRGELDARGPRGPLLRLGGSAELRMPPHPAAPALPLTAADGAAEELDRALRRYRALAPR
ncbi:unnamed protein product [Prorocentrum cordatum]|nr:unnamed protein product [Polarella glacialis]